jgi:hypothetical protein
MLISKFKYDLVKWCELKPKKRAIGFGIHAFGNATNIGNISNLVMFQIWSAL